MSKFCVCCKHQTGDTSDAIPSETNESSKPTSWFTGLKLVQRPGDDIATKEHCINGNRRAPVGAADNL